MSQPPAPSQAYKQPKLDFIGKPAPPGYVAGIGRGATGFTTRSDIGPAREPALVPVASGSGTQAKRPADAEDEEEDLNESNYDEFAGYGGSLFKGDPYDSDDAEADRIYAEIDRRMANRGKPRKQAKLPQPKGKVGLMWSDGFDIDLGKVWRERQRSEARARQEELERRKRPPSIQEIKEAFKDLKADLKNVTMEQWLNLPEVGDARNRKKRVARQDKYTPAPDSLLAHQAKLASGGDRLVYLDPSEMSEHRGAYMSMQLSRVSATSGYNNQAAATNAQDYLTKLDSLTPSQITNMDTVDEYRKQFRKLREKNEKWKEAWILSIRLEEAAGKLKAAKSLSLLACERCSGSADLWLEAIRLHPPDYSIPLIELALDKVPHSEKLWLKRAELEATDEGRRQVFANARRKSVRISKSELVWKRSVDLEPPEQARCLLKDAVKECPNSVDLWLALVRLSPYEEALIELKKANDKNPKDRRIWLTGAKLQELVGKYDLVKEIISRSVSDLAERGVEIKRADWFQEAANADRANFNITCREIIKRVIGWNVSEPDKLKTWLGDAQGFIEGGSINCARAVFETIVESKAFSKTESVWQEFAKFERAHGDNKSLISVLERAVERGHCDQSETLWLTLANEKRDELAHCRQILSKALTANPDSEKIVVAAVELEFANGNHSEARRILADACKSAKTPQLVMRAAELERSLGDTDAAIRILEAGKSEFKNYPDFYLSLGQIAEQQNDIDKAKSCYSDGLKSNSTSVKLWINMARLDERTSLARARARLETARLRNKKNVELWLEAAQLEWKQYSAKAASGPQRSRPDIVHTLLANGIKECKDQPEVGKLIEMQAQISKRKFG